jgi:L-2-hydroxyglutarate oxidase LhgO
MNSDYLIIGAGIVGLSIAYSIQKKKPKAKIVILEKEVEIGLHASGRNSGVLHAGFYYTSNTKKAQFTKDGNAKMKAFCKEHNLKLNECGKVVVAKNKKELERLEGLCERAKANKVELKLIDEAELAKIEPNASTYRKALYSPTTATVEPLEVLKKLASIVEANGAKIYKGTKFLYPLGKDKVVTDAGEFKTSKVINCAGLYADRVAQQFGFGKDYTVVPFKGKYLEYTGDDSPVSTNIYPVPNPLNPFLGVHFTVKADGKITLGPSASPVFWRENYKACQNFKFDECLETIWNDTKMFVLNRSGFRKLAIQECKRVTKSSFQEEAKKMVRYIDAKKFSKWSKAGIRAQLVDKRSMTLVDDFIVEGDKSSVHILNAVSPAFTCSFAFAEWVVEKYL